MKPFVPPPPPGAQPPPLWGDLAHVRELLGDRVTDLRASQQLLRVDEPGRPGGVPGVLQDQLRPDDRGVPRSSPTTPTRVAELDQALVDLVERFRTPDGGIELGVPPGRRHRGLTAQPRRHAASGPTISSPPTIQ